MVRCGTVLFLEVVAGGGMQEGENNSIWICRGCRCFAKPSSWPKAIGLHCGLCPLSLLFVMQGSYTYSANWLLGLLYGLTGMWWLWPAAFWLCQGQRSRLLLLWENKMLMNLYSKKMLKMKIYWRLHKWYFSVKCSCTNCIFFSTERNVTCWHWWYVCSSLFWFRFVSVCYVFEL